MTGRTSPIPDTIETDRHRLLEAVHRRAENLFLTRQLECAEAVLAVLNHGFDGGLPPELAVRLVSGLPEGIGGSGCTCGALSGGVVGLGLFLGRNGPGIRNGRPAKAAARCLHDRFRDRFGATCCRVLTKSLVWGSKAHFEVCAGRTGAAAAMAARLLLERIPELTDAADWSYLLKKDTGLGAGLRRIRGTRLLHGQTLFE